jgi:5,10-methylenetetrahydromethanopterin reductase
MIRPDAAGTARPPLRVGIRIPPFQSVDQLVQVVARAEALGFHDAWFPDSQLLWRDVFSVLTAAALNTERIRLGSAVTNVATRHPSVIASAARSIAELAPGRFVLGVGVGNSSLLPVGLRPSTQNEMRNAIAMIRALLSGADWSFGERSGRLRDPAPDVPIYMAATGPRNLRLAGEIADGVLLLSGVAPAALTRAASLSAEGVAASGRDAAAVPLTVSAYCHVTEDVERDVVRLKPVCAAIAQNGGTDFLRRVGIDVRVPAHVAGVYPDLVHAEDWPAAVDICGRWVSDADAIRFADAFCLFGTGQQIAERLRLAQQAGATGVFLQHVGSYDAPTEVMHAVAEHVFPLLHMPERNGR